MGIDRLTAYIIANREDIVITHAGPSKDGKYMGWITLGEEDRYRPLLNSEAIHDTPKEAEQVMRDLVVGLKGIVEKETGGKDPIEHLMGYTKEAKIVKDIIRLSK